jgi:hypothetical protein
LGADVPLMVLCVGRGCSGKGKLENKLFGAQNIIHNNIFVTHHINGILMFLFAEINYTNSDCQ